MSKRLFGKRTVAVMLLAVAIATALSACVPQPSVTVKITPPAQDSVVIQRNALLTVAASRPGPMASRRPHVPSARRC